ncbi:MAG: agmatine deiminase family protein [Bacteroidetes bacterium]|nr:agmatine deiminase family protein [Bacteroidota bacterium]MBT6685189.1 agmatine deiminase family protein [Bacteroidota bacterium]MBT7143446.1 agmatine deiminase family protein [Bacteroidota bacterium]MBT7492042.1 agmatine deiminase family protein [Bacteroidota bacterium]
MKKNMISLLSLLFVCLSWSCTKEDIKNELDNIQYPDTTVLYQNARVPAEWEPHGATWIQWALDWEASMRKPFADIIAIVKQYEPVHLITISETEKTEAIEFMANEGVTQDNITWHIFDIDNSWMRDCGPIYLTDGEHTWIQNWKFDGWGTGFGNIPWQNDNQVPVNVAGYLGLEVEDRQDYVLEKGNVEVNGNGILVINWDCQKDRNPNVSQAHQEILLKNALGITKVIWAYGHYDGDGTIGHIDGTARFIDENTIVIADYGSNLENNLALACQNEDLEVIMYPGDLNWLVGNGFVVAMGNGNANDELIKSELEELWPNHDVHVIDGSNMVDLGGGIHCVTNDQPVIF